MIQIDFETHRRLQLYRAKYSTVENNLKTKELVKDAINFAIDAWELTRLEDDDHK